MKSPVANPIPQAQSPRAARVAELFHEQWQNIIQHTNRLFFWLMICQWFFAVGLAFWLSPRVWNGTTSSIHPHVWIAVFIGGLVTSVPVILTWLQPERPLTRHVVAIGQMLMSALLIHITGGRIETHFHVFGSLAILAFYRDWPVLISASAVVYVDHLLRGFFIPESVYGVLSASIWRSFEHAGWVAFEVVFLVIAIRKSLSEMRAVAERQAELESVNEIIEQTVATRTAELTQAQEIARLGSWEWDVVHDKTTWSAETQRIYGWEASDFGGRTMQECMDERIHPDDLPRMKEIIGEALQTGRPFVCEHRIRLPDGTERTAVGRGQVQLDETGRPVKMFGVVQDITEAKNAELALLRSQEQLRHAQKMEAVGRLAGGVAHDFNNLLTVINGYSAMSLQKLQGPSPVRHDLEEILKAAERASGLTQQLLAFSRKQVMQPRVLDLNDTIAGLEKMLHRLIGENIELRTVLGSRLGQIKADPGQIEQVVLNLAVNARDAMPRGGKLTITTTNVTLDQKSVHRNRILDVGEYVMLAVSDTGVGMTEEVKAHLFEPFFTTKGVGKGTGLGLATCYGIIVQTGGDIRVYSEPDSGTTFKIFLPRTDELPTSKDRSETEELPAGTERVLVIEDEASVRKFTVTVLRNCGYEVAEMDNAVKALSIFEAGLKFDLIISDVIMPQMNGKEFYDRIKPQIGDTRMLFISGYTDDALADLGVLSGPLAFLEKPYSPARLARKVREVLDGNVEDRNLASNRSTRPR